MNTNLMISLNLPADVWNVHQINGNISLHKTPTNYNKYLI